MAWLCLPSLKLVYIVALWFYFTPKRERMLGGVHHHIYTLALRRSGLLTFFSSLVIQECLINFAGERLRSRMTSHCEIILGFYLSASHPELNSGVKLSSPSQKWRAFPETSAERFTFLPAFRSNVPFLGAMSHILKRSFIFIFKS